MNPGRARFGSSNAIFAPMNLKEVSDARTLRDWTRLPWRIYADDKSWIPHLKQDVEKVFDPAKNKLLGEHDGHRGAIIRWVLYGGDGSAIGRIAAFVNPKTAFSEKDQPTGGCGFFECINDQQAANLLFDAARDWLKARGMEAMDGPVNLGDRNMFWGLQIKNFTDPPLYGTNYNPEYYIELFERYGFGLWFKQLFFKRSMDVGAQPIFQRKYRQLMSDPRFRIHDGRGRSAEQLAQDFCDVYNAAWVDHENHKPMELSTARKMVKAMKPVMDPRLLIFIRHDDKAVAMYLSLPELNEIFKHVNGDLNWIGKLKFLWHKWRGTVQNMTGIVFGVAKEWQGKGLEGALIVYADQFLVQKKLYKDTVLTWIGDFNPRMLKVCQNLETVNYRDLATYRYLFDRTKPFHRMPIIEKNG